MLRKFSLWWHGEPESTTTKLVVDIKDGKFPDGLDFAIFQAIEDLRRGKASLGDLHRICKATPAALKKKIDIVNITGAEERSYFGSLNRTFKGNDLKPLHYAFITGREDAFRLLLAEGAGVNGSISFQCTSMNPAENEKSKRFGTLEHLMRQNHNYISVMNCFFSREVINAIFIALMQRNKTEDVLYIMFSRITEHARHQSDYLDRSEGKNWRSRKIPLYAETSPLFAESMFPFLPSIEDIKQSLGRMDPSSTPMLNTLIFTLQTHRHNAENKVRDYVTFSDDAVKIALKVIDSLIECFSYLRDNIDEEISHSDYLENSLQKFLELDRNYDRTNKKKGYTDLIHIHINRFLHLIDEDDLAEKPLELLRLIIDSAKNMIHRTECELYREALLDFIKNQVNGHAANGHHHDLEELSVHLSTLKLPISEDALSTELESAKSVVSQIISGANSHTTRLCRL